MFTGTMDLRLFDESQLHRPHGAFRLRNKIDVVDAVLVERNRPYRAMQFIAPSALF